MCDCMCVHAYISLSVFVFHSYFICAQLLVGISTVHSKDYQSFEVTLHHFFELLFLFIFLFLFFELFRCE